MELSHVYLTEFLDQNLCIILYKEWPVSWDDFNPTLTNPGTKQEFSALHFAAMNGYRSMPIIQYYQQEIKFTEFEDSGPHDINPLDKEKSYTPMMLSMTSLLTHTVAHSTKPSFRPKINKQPLKKFLSLSLS